FVAPPSTTASTRRRATASRGIPSPRTGRCPDRGSWIATRLRRAVRSFALVQAPQMTGSRTMSRYIRWEFRRWGKGHLVLYIHGQMGFPYLLIARQREHLGVSSSFEWWPDDERFYCGFPPWVIILDCRDQTYSVRSAGWDEQGVPAMIVDPVEVEISVE